MAMSILKGAFVASGLTVAALAAGTACSQEDTAPFGGRKDVNYAKDLWEAMTEANLTGDNAVYSRPYEGNDPHGIVLDTVYSSVTVDGHDGTVIVKRNYGPAGISIDEVASDPPKHLEAITVMFKREAGYDDENQDWFWVKYLPDGALDKNPAGAALAGRIGKGAAAGCIACHTAADGDDYEFHRNHNVPGT